MGSARPSMRRESVSLKVSPRRKIMRLSMARAIGASNPAPRHGWHGARIAISPPRMNAPAPALSAAPNFATRPAPELTIVVPTFKERDNVPLLVDKLAETLAGIDWEV